MTADGGGLGEDDREPGAREPPLLVVGHRRTGQNPSNNREHDHAEQTGLADRLRRVEPCPARQRRGQRDQEPGRDVVQGRRRQGERAERALDHPALGDIRARTGKAVIDIEKAMSRAKARKRFGGASRPYSGSAASRPSISGNNRLVFES